MHRRAPTCRAAAALAIAAAMLAVGAHAQEPTLEERLRARCLAAIGEGELAPSLDGLKETLAVAAGEGGFLFQWEAENAGTVSCQLCDVVDRSFHCASLGLRLAVRPSGGELRDLPAELDRKCVEALQKDVGDTGPGHWIDWSIVDRITVEPRHTDTRWVYTMRLDDDEYRCVVRKSDGTWRVERREGEEWRSIGTMGRFF